MGIKMPTHRETLPLLGWILALVFLIVLDVASLFFWSVNDMFQPLAVLVTILLSAGVVFCFIQANKADDKFGDGGM